jgi:hypothetical protein
LIQRAEPHLDLVRRRRHLLRLGDTHVVLLKELLSLREKKYKKNISVSGCVGGVEEMEEEERVA